MSLENDDTNNLPEFAPISSNQRVQKTIQNSSIASVDSSVNVNLKTIILQHAAISSIIDKFTNTFCDQLKNLTSILKHNVNVAQTSRHSSSTSSQKQFLAVKTRHNIKRLEKVITKKFLPRMILMIPMIMMYQLINALGLTPISAVCSNQQHQHKEMMIK